MATKRTSAYLKATQEAQQKQPTVLPENSSTVEPLQRDTALPHNSKAAKKEEKVTFYLTSGQADKLDDLAYDHKKRTGKRINRNDIVRYLIDQCTTESLNNKSLACVFPRILW